MFSQSKSKNIIPQDNAQKLKEYLQLDDKDFKLENNIEVTNMFISNSMSMDEAVDLYEDLRAKLTALDPFNDKAVEITFIGKNPRKSDTICRIDSDIHSLEGALNMAVDELTQVALRAQMVHLKLLKKDLVDCFITITVANVKKLDRLVFEPFQEKRASFSR